MIIIRYTVSPDLIYTWFIHDRYLTVISFGVGLFISAVVMRLYVNRLERRMAEKVKNTPRGGIDIGECLDPNFIYEIKNELLAKTIRKMLGKSGKGLLVVDPLIVILANYAMDSGWEIASFWFRSALQMIFTDRAGAVVRVLIGLSAGLGLGGPFYYLAFHFMKASFVSSLLLAFTIGLPSAFLADVVNEGIKCDQIFKIVGYERQTTKQLAYDIYTSGVVETRRSFNNHIYVAPWEADVTLYPQNRNIPSFNYKRFIKDLFLPNESLFFPKDNHTLNPYKRNMTDVRHFDDTANLEYLGSREKRLSTIDRYKANRQRIKNGRLSQLRARQYGHEYQNETIHLRNIRTENEL